MSTLFDIWFSRERCWARQCYVWLYIFIVSMDSLNCCCGVGNCVWVMLVVVQASRRKEIVRIFAEGSSRTACTMCLGQTHALYVYAITACPKLAKQCSVPRHRWASSRSMQVVEQFPFLLASDFIFNDNKARQNHYWLWWELWQVQFIKLPLKWRTVWIKRNYQGFARIQVVYFPLPVKLEINNNDYIFTYSLISET